MLSMNVYKFVEDVHQMSTIEDAWTNMFQMDAYTLEKHVSDVCYGCLDIHFSNAMPSFQDLHFTNGQTCYQWMYTSFWKMFIQMSKIEDAWTNMFQMDAFTLEKHVSDVCDAWTFTSQMPCLPFQDIQVQMEAWTNML